MLNGKLVGETTGFISGLILDFMTGIPFGFNCLFRTIIGYIYGIFSKTIILSGIIMPMLSVAIGTVSTDVLILVFHCSFIFPPIWCFGKGFRGKSSSSFQG